MISVRATLRKTKNLRLRDQIYEDKIIKWAILEQTLILAHSFQSKMYFLICETKYSFGKRSVVLISTQETALLFFPISPLKRD